ncbi:DUF7318 family protein [Halorussus halobius]|uniref:DUF7318 family protein n=1 Tax=Halorussus halobius TaxID=1710537 RepID=UPI00109261C6|nr:hypothetical protein [Halorussus halobius]
MSSTGSTYGDIHRYEPARESTAAAIAIVLLTIVEVAFVGLFTYGLVTGWGYTAIGNMYLGGVLAVIFIDLAFILLLYRKEFLPDVMIVKKRRRKWEDLYVREGQQHGVDSLGNAWDQFKRAVYPFYKR